MTAIAPSLHHSAPHSTTLPLYHSITLFLLFLPALACAGDFSSSSVGTTAAGFLKLGVGARAVALGEAYSALADDAGAVTWNPAALTRVSKRSATLMHGVHLDESFLDYGAFAQKLGHSSAWGAAFQYFAAGKITETDAAGTELGKFSPNDMAVSLAFAHRLTSGFSLGLSGKLIQSTVLKSAQTAAADAGLLSPSFFDDQFSFALTVSNAGGKMKFENESERLPLLVKAGAAWRAEDMAAGLEVGLPVDNNPFVAFGVEDIVPVSGEWSVAGRAGINTRTLKDIDGFTGISLGLGLIHPSFSWDYGFLPFGPVGLSHRMSLSFRF
ncbi:MAG: PorV/PorQ family protein [Elusimicrobia bacterium]|nr:PorV/PorQ family protein [Elusimicrobiota bacterium]